MSIPCYFVSLFYILSLFYWQFGAQVQKTQKWEAKRRIGKKEMVAVLILFIVACLWRWCVYVIPYNNKDNNSSFFGAIVTLISRSGSCPAVALTRNCRTTRSVIRHSQERRCQKRQTRRLQGKNQGKWKEIDSFFISEIIIIIINNHNNKQGGTEEAASYYDPAGLLIEWRVRFSFEKTFEVCRSEAFFCVWE